MATIKTDIERIRTNIFVHPMRVTMTDVLPQIEDELTQPLDDHHAYGSVTLISDNDYTLTLAELT